MAAPLTNWAGNVAFAAVEVRAPSSLDELSEIVRGAPRVRAVGARHSFSEVVQSGGVLVDARGLAGIGEPDGAGLVRVGAGTTYGDLCTALARGGRAVANLASLPHVTVAGAVATATHGSGAAQPSLAAAVRALEVVGADGEARVVGVGDDDFDGRVVSLGALGVVAAVTLATVPEFELRQVVFEDLPWRVVEDELLPLLALGYSTSVFTTWVEPVGPRVWLKTHDDVPELPARRATRPAHPIAGADPAHCTAQLGVPGPSAERLPHFRYDGVPSAGDELQSEYALAAGDAAAAVRALRAIGERIAPHLHVGEIRAIAADGQWLSPFYRRDTVAFHFTWKRRPAVPGAIALVEDALRPFAPRPHWGKLSGYGAAHLRSVHPRLDDFVALRRRVDPDGKFGNAFVDRL